jgi:hypothetical protein
MHSRFFKFYNIMNAICFLFICFSIIIQSKVWSQDTSCSFCGQFSWGNGFESVGLKIYSDHEFTYIENTDAGENSNAFGTWRDSNNIVFLTTEPAPQIIWAEEGMKTEDSVLIMFYSEDSQNISWELNESLLSLSLNGIVQKCKQHYSNNASGDNMDLLIYSTKAPEIRPLSTLDISVDHISSRYNVRNPKANVFRFGLSILTSRMRFFKNEPFLFKDDSYYKVNKTGRHFDQRVLTKQR